MLNNFGLTLIRIQQFTYQNILTKTYSQLDLSFPHAYDNSTLTSREANMDKEPDLDNIDLDDVFKKEHEQAENDSDERGVDKPRFFNLKKRTLFIAGVVILIIIFVALLSLRGFYLSESDFSALTKRMDRIEERLANLEEKTQYHVVARGESLSQIAGKYGLTVDKLRNLNKMTPRQNIQAGQKLRVSAVKGS
jgi:hypothetical protein